MAFSDLLAVADRACLTHLGRTVRYEPNIGVAVDVTGVFDAEYVRVDAGQAGLESSGPAVFLRLEDLKDANGVPLPDPDDDEPTITVAGVAYRVRERQKDGQGGIRLLLHRAD